MLGRRRFATCAVCSAAGLIASRVDAGAQPANGLHRTILHKTEFPGDTYVIIQAKVEIPPGFQVARHTHPGVETAYLLQGGGTLSVKGEDSREVKAGDGFQIPPETPHSLRNGSAPSVVLVTYVVDKNKPLVTPAPE